MAYILERFGTLTLPVYNPRYSLDTVEAKNTIVKTVAGGFDTAGDGEAALDLPQAINYRGVILEDSLSAWRTAIDTLRAQSRKRARLYRRSWDTDEVQFCTARFMSAQTERDFQQARIYDVRLRFLQQTPWVGHDHTAWTLDSGEILDDALYLDDSGYTFTLDTSPKSVVVVNGGNRATSNVRLSITAGSANITALTIACGDAEFVCGATVSVGDVLVIDSGAQAVTDDGVAAYGSFALTSNHSIDEWIRLEPGDNTITVTKTGGSTNSTLLVEFQDGWE